MRALTPEECLVYAMMDSKTAFDGLLRAGIKEAYFSPSYVPVFTRIVKRRLENDTFQLSALELGETNKEKTFLLNLCEAAAAQNVYSTAWKSYYDQVRNAYNKKAVTEILGGLNTYSHEELLEVCTKIMGSVDGQGAKITPTSEIIESLLKMFEERQDPNYENPYRVGMPRYDQLGHFIPGSLVILGGSSGHGKSTLAINLAYRWAKAGMKVLYFSYEMTPEVIIAKMNCINTRLSWDKAMNLKGECFSPEEKARYKLGIGDIRGMKITINDHIQGLPEIAGVVNAYEPDVFIVDTINHLIDQASGANEKFWIYLGKVARAFKEIAKKRKIICVALAQLKEYLGRPASKSFIGESKEIMNTADYMDFIYRAKEGNIIDFPPELENILEVYRVKGRLTGIGSAFLHIDEKTSFIRNLSYGEEDTAMEALRKHIKGQKRSGK
jgi:archaellum biogenesis ATPase FlaH